MIKKYIFFLTWGISFCLLSSAKADLASDLLKQSDMSRGGLIGGVAWKVHVDSVEEGETSSRDFYVKSKGDDAYVEALLPARNKGEIYLFKGTNMWFFKPSLKKPISISGRQRLSGQAANGDIASTNYLRDYSATLGPVEKINQEDVQILNLKAKTKTVTYDQIRYWISTKSKLAVKAEFLTLKGETFKTAEYEYKNVLPFNGKNIAFISQMIVKDAKFPANKSTLVYQSPQLQKISDSLFQVGNLSR